MFFFLIDTIEEVCAIVEMATTKAVSRWTKENGVAQTPHVPLKEKILMVMSWKFHAHQEECWT